MISSHISWMRFFRSVRISSTKSTTPGSYVFTMNSSSSTMSSVERTRKPRPVSSFWQKMHLNGQPRVVKM